MSTVQESLASISLQPSQLAWNRDQKGRFESIFDVDISVCQIVVPKTLKLNKNDQKSNRKNGGGGALSSLPDCRVRQSRGGFIHQIWVDIYILARLDYSYKATAAP